MRQLNKPGNHSLLLKGIVSIITLLMVSSCNPSGFNRKNIIKYRQMRSEKLNQSRPVIHNNDGCDAYVYPLKYRKFLTDTENQPRQSSDTALTDYEFSIPNFLNLRSAGLTGSDVTTLSYCTISSSFGQFTHNTEVGEFLTLTHQRPGRRNVVPEFVKLGTDPLEVTCKFAHDKGFEFFWSNRINDTHDYEHRPDKPYERWSKLKTAHPEYLFGTPGEKLPHGRWSAIDFSHQEIRDLCVKYYEEVCENYDVDGIELDFFRHAYLFGNVARGETASSEQLDMITEMVAQIREMTERVGIKKEKPILILVRVPDSFEYCKGVGIDLEKWMQQGLVDIVVGSGYFRLNPWDHLIENCNKYGVKYYAGLSEPRIKNEYPSLQRLQNTVYRARAAAAWEAGVDGIYIFNEYNTRSQYLREIGNPGKLKNKNNLYFVTYRNGSPNSYLKNGKDYTSIPILSPVNPVPLTSEPLNLTMEIGDESDSARVFLFLYSPELNPKELKVSINKVQADYMKSTNDGLHIFEVPHIAVQPGKNNLTVSNATRKSKVDDYPSLLDAAILFYRNEDDMEINKLIELCIYNYEY